MDTNRKASDILLDLESKINNMLLIIQSQDLNIKILSNKINTLMSSLNKNAAAPKVTVEAVSVVNPTNIVNSINPKNIDYIPDNTLSVETSPKGFRRTSRSETYQGDNSYLPSKDNTANVVPKFPIQTPQSLNKKNVPEVVVPTTNQNIESDVVFPEHNTSSATQSDKFVPVVQRIVNAAGKSVFMAEVEIFSPETGKSEKTRTGPTGKWSHALKPGNYSVTIRKQESLTKEKFEATQNIKVDGNESKVELQTMIIK